MGIKRIIKSIFLIFSLISLILINSINLNIYKVIANESDEWPKTYIDKVYKFNFPKTTRIFELAFREHYYYIIDCELVTPNECNITLHMIDPDDIEFEIYNATMSFYFENTKKFTVPFGTAKNGTYELKITVETEYNLNLHIAINEGDMCIYDKLVDDVFNDNIVYKVHCFSSGIYNELQFLANLENDTWYRIIAARVSPIAYTLPATQMVNLTIIDPEADPYLIFDNTTYLPEKLEFADVLFGIAFRGSYLFKFGIASAYPKYNFAYLIYEFGKIGQGINETQAYEINNPVNDSINNYTSNFNTTFYYEIPQEGYFLMIVVSIVVVIVIILSMQARKIRIKGLEQGNREKPINEKKYKPNQTLEKLE